LRENTTKARDHLLYSSYQALEKGEVADTPNSG